MEKIVHKIAKLLALAVDQAGKPEGDRAAETANRLMAQYGVDESEVSNKQKDPTELVIDFIDIPYGTLWCARILQAACTMASCSMLHLGSGAEQAVISGRRCDVLVASYLFDLFMLQFHEEEAKYVQEVAEKHGLNEKELRSARGWKPLLMGWRKSFAEGVMTKAIEIVKKEKSSDTSVGLVLYDRRKASKEFLKGKFLSTTKNAPKINNAVAYAAGKSVSTRAGMSSSSKPSQMFCR